ncbi:MAG TPA: HAMP domain-containing sensor histidine kinase [Kofleriaceae bacterium]|nr:HAMP domain-containing sensor histidine kinase [Kofleriaceae bacterium]
MDLLVEWMTSGLVGHEDGRFHASRSTAGDWRVIAGMPRRHAVTVVNLVRGEYQDGIDQLYEPSGGRRVARSVDKLLDVELALLLHDHLDAHAELPARGRSAQSDRIAAIQTLSAGLAHEIRNPLNSARLQLELLDRRLRRADAAAQLIEPVDQVSREIERLTRLLNEFLAFARPSELVLGDHDILAIARDAVAAQRPFATTRGAAIQVAGADSLRARVDARKLAQILQNLVRNALEAVAPGGHVIVTVHGDDDRVHLIVEDDGPGIPEPIQRRIYEPFFTTKETGTGLGLSIVHGMVAALGGTISLASSSRGTRFDVWLPRRA